MNSSGPDPDDDASGLLAKVGTGDNSPALSVSELSGALKRTVEQAFGHVRVRGEISGWKRHGSGHCYFTLKDDSACMDAVLWRGQAGRLSFAPEDGAEVIATGKLTTYPGRSKYQIVVDRLELAGEGALMALLDRRRRALAAEGLFDESRKRPLPHLPRIIGVITSPTGAVIRDILHRLADRCPCHVIVWPVPVQGEGAAEKITAAIRGFQAMGSPPELLIVARGGGSIEDLWAFNEEIVVRAAHESVIPLISAVGHETDTTLIDFAADRRAPTPTAAAEMAVPVVAELAGLLDSLGGRLAGALARGSADAGERLHRAVERWPQPEVLLQPAAAKLADPASRLPRALAARAAHARGDFGMVATRLRTGLLDSRLERLNERLSSLWRLAELAHPERPLARGFARVTADDGTTLTTASSTAGRSHLRLRFADGEIGAVPDGAPGVEAKVASSYRRANPAAVRQPGLFDDA